MHVNYLGDTFFATRINPPGCILNSIGVRNFGGKIFNPFGFNSSKLCFVRIFILEG